MARKAWTSFGVGRDLAAAWVAAQSTKNPPPAAATRVEEIEVPAGVAPNKFGTTVQQVMVDPGALTAVAPGQAEAVRVAAAKVEDNPDLALAVSLEGTPAGDKLVQRSGSGTPGEAAYLIFGLGVDTGGTPSENQTATDLAGGDIPRAHPGA